MKSRILFYLVSCSYIAIHSCTATANVEKENSANLKDYKTYMWVNLMTSKEDSTSKVSSLAQIPVHNAVNEQLHNWSWQEVKENPDVFISYDILVEHRKGKKLTKGI